MSPLSAQKPNILLDSHGHFISLQIEAFRCISNTLIEFSPQLNVFSGDNGAGKTTILEALSVLNTGRSFRSHRASSVIQHNTDYAVALGSLVSSTGRSHTLGVQLGRHERTIKIDGSVATSRAELSQHWIAQVIDPNIHFLVDGGPDQRRTFLNWGVFHVEPKFLEKWQRYRRILQQRNVALKAGLSESEIRAWDIELIELGEAIRDGRDRYLAELSKNLTAVSDQLLGSAITLEHRWGWAKNRPLGEILAGSLDKDRAFKSTQAG
ncbi:MAG: DNA replication/repair protein RecF, partial [Gammaproteobacteria bacterium]|nr:DNA replication/repair protein RecF [Gammaproteobacteria bacterium]